MVAAPNEICCPKFDPKPWDEHEIKWDNKRFVTDRVRSFLHIPLNFGGVMMRNMALIEAAGAKPEDMIVLSDENSLWGADIYISVTKDVPQAKPATLSGTFLSKVFEGPYKDVHKWCVQMQETRPRRRQGFETHVLLLHNLPQVRQKARQELRRPARQSVSGGRRSGVAWASTLARVDEGSGFPRASVLAHATRRYGTADTAVAHEFTMPVLRSQRR